jgi:hypothetical protein
MADDTLNIFDVTETKLSDVWSEFLKNDEVGCAMTVPAPGGPPRSLSCTSKHFWNLIFNTTENNVKFATAETDGVFQPDGYNISGNAVLGLSAKQAQDIKCDINDVLGKFGVVTPDTGLVKDIIVALGNPELSLGIDFSDTRCAMWLIWRPND